MRELTPITHRLLPACLDACIAARHPALVFGEPGIGKSEGWEQSAARNGMRPVFVHLNQLTPGDVHGHRFPDIDTRTTVQFHPAFFPGPGDPPTLLIFDEVLSSPELTRKPAFELLLNNRLGSYVLDPKHAMGAATNTGDDGVQVFQLDRASADRFCAILLMPELDQWVSEYALPRKLDSRIVAFLRQNPRRFAASLDPDNDNTIVPSPRAWSIASRILASWERRNPAGTPETARERLEASRPLIAGKVGNQAADEFITFSVSAHLENSVTTVLAAPPGARSHLFPNTSHGLFLLCSALPTTLHADPARCVQSCIDALILAAELAEHTTPADDAIMHAPEAAAWAVNSVLEQLQHIDPNADVTRIHEHSGARPALGLAGIEISPDPDDSLSDTLSASLAAF